VSDRQLPHPESSELRFRPSVPASGWQAGLGAISARREVIWLSLAAAELCWAVPIYWAIIQPFVPHAPLLLWLGMLVIMLGFFFFYRALVSAELSLRLQQGLLAAGMLLCIIFALRFHVLPGSDIRAVDWLLMPFRDLSDVPSRVPLSWFTIMFLIYLWARAIHLANRSLSTEQVGFSFRSGVLLLVVAAVLVQVRTSLDASGFVIAYFFFALVAIALARIEEVRRLPNSTQVPFGGFWIGTTVGAVAILVALGAALVLFLTGGGLQVILRLLAPVLRVGQAIVVFVGTLLVSLLDRFLDLFSLDFTGLDEQLREALTEFSLQLESPEVPPPDGESQSWMIISRVLQIFFTVVLPVIIVSFILLLSWRRVRQRRAGELNQEARESLLSRDAVVDRLQGMLRDGLQRLGELAGLARRFGPGARFLTAVSIRRIYRNMVRMATDVGYPRSMAQTPYEYLATLRQAFPSNEAEAAIITEAYVNAHYGQVPDSQEELQRIRDCWERMRSTGVTRSRDSGKHRSGAELD